MDGQEDQVEDAGGVRAEMVNNIVHFLTERAKRQSRSLAAPRCREMAIRLEKSLWLRAESNIEVCHCRSHSSRSAGIEWD